ncbi:MAG: nicotinamide riboside transporter PnuC [Candidatus Ozemobacteraceae bacterium]
MSWLELVGAVLGFVSVLLTIKQHIACFPVGIAQVILYIFIFFEARLYSDVILQIFYVILLAYGWYTWVRGKNPAPEHFEAPNNLELINSSKPPDNASLNPSEELPVSILSPTRRACWVLVTLVGTITLGAIMKANTRADFAYLDAFQTVMSLIAQYLMSFKILESWLIWIAVDVLSVGMYYLKGLYPTTVLYALFLGMALFGFLEWRTSFLRNAVSPIVNPPVRS